MNAELLRLEDVMVEREFEIGKDEAWFANVKRTYDEYQNESLESIRRNRSIVDKLISDSQSHDNQLRQLSVQAMQNAIETANMVGKQAVRHGDLAIDRQWNIDEQAVMVEQIVSDQVFQDAIAAAVASAVTSTLAKK